MCILICDERTERQVEAEEIAVALILNCARDEFYVLFICQELKQKDDKHSLRSSNSNQVVLYRIN